MTNPHQGNPADKPADDRKPGLPEVDVFEYGGRRGDGERPRLNRRLFVQLLVFRAPLGDHPDGLALGTAELLRERRIPGVVYADINDPRGIGLLTWFEDPAHFATMVRPLFATERLSRAELRTDMTMIGRTYTLGYEPDLETVLFNRPINNMLNDAWPWHVWYPLRRTGAFARLDAHEQSQILREHASIGMAYGQANLGHDIRLACHGLDAADNEFVVGLVSDQLHPLSHLVQTMRKTRQTSEFISQMGPFFVGHVLARSAVR